MHCRIHIFRIFVAILLGLGVSRLHAQSDPQVGVPVRIWANTTSGDDTETVPVNQYSSTSTATGGTNEHATNSSGTGHYRHSVTTWVPSNIELDSTPSLEPWKLAAQGMINPDGAVKDGATADGPGQGMTVDLGMVRAVPGKTYQITANMTNTDGGALNAVAPPGYHVVLNGMVRNSCPLSGAMTLRVLPDFDAPGGIAGFTSTVASLRVDWRISLGSLLNGDPAGYLELTDSGMSPDLSYLFTPAALSYESTSGEVYVYQVSNVIHQVIANQVALDIRVPSGSTTDYYVDCYNPAQITTYAPCSFSGTPFVTYHVAKSTTSDPTAVVLTITRQTRNVTDPTTKNVAVARTETLVLQRSGTAPDYTWTKSDWTVAGQTPLLGTTVESPHAASVFYLQPSSQTATTGSTVTFSAAATGGPAPTYQWQKNSTNISGATSQALTLTNVQSTDAATYTVKATNSPSGSAVVVTSNSATLTVTGSLGTSPIFTLQPASLGVRPGDMTTLSVTVAGSPTPTVQWKKNGASISGATNAALTIVSVASADAASYTVVATNSHGSATSDAATLSLLADRTDVITAGAPGGPVAISLKRVFPVGPSGEEMGQEIVGTSSSRTTGFSYYTDSAAPGTFGFVKSVSLPGGGWEAYDYYDTTVASGYQTGQVKYRYRPFVNYPTSQQSLTQGEVTYYEYATDPFGFRTWVSKTQTFVNGIEVGRSLTNYSSSGALTTVTNQTYTGSASSTSAKLVYYTEDNTDAYYRGKPVESIESDGTKQMFAFERGVWNGTTFASATTYGANATCSRITVYHGLTTSAPGLVGSALTPSVAPDSIWVADGRSTKEVSIRDERALLVRTESYVWHAGDWQLVSWVNNAYDFTGLPTTSTASNGGVKTARYDAGWKSSDIDETGLVTNYLYDAAGRVRVATKVGAGTIPTLNTYFQYDAIGNIIEQRVGDTDPLVTRRQYDDVGRVISETFPGKGPTTHAYDVANRTHTATQADASTIIEAANIDGSRASKTGTALVAQFFTYGVDVTTGFRWTRSNAGLAVSPRWQQTYKDWVGRAYATVRPAPGSTTTGFDGNFSSPSIYLKQSFYDDVANHSSTSHLIKTTETGMAPTLYIYDSFGHVNRSGLDLDGNGTLDLVSNDRISEHDLYLELIGGSWWSHDETRAYVTATSGTPSIMSIKRRRLNGHSAGRLDEIQQTDTNGNVTTQTTDVSPSTSTVTLTTITTGISHPRIEVLIDGLATSVTGNDGLKATTDYDALWRKHIVTDARNNATTTAYIAATSLVSTITDATSTIVETLTYDGMGRKITSKGADLPDPSHPTGPLLDNTNRISYTMRGQVWRQWGKGAIPVEYGYDSIYGDKVTMSTFRDGTNWGDETWPTSGHAADTTTWGYDVATGLLLSKTDATNHAVTYTYTARGQLSRRTWARGVHTDYTYDPGTAEQRNIVYDDSYHTPNLSYQYNRLGQNSEVDDATGSRLIAYCICGKIASEQLDAAFFGGRKLAYALDQADGVVLGRTVGYTLAHGATYEESLTYHYDAASGRLADIATLSPVSASAHTFHYGYLANSDLIESLSTDTAAPFTITRTFEPHRDVLTAIDSKWSSTSRVRYDYVVDARGQRSSVKQSGDAFADYYDSSNTSTFQALNYNSRGELIGALGYLGDSAISGHELPGRQYAFAYDQVGNRQSSNATTNSGLADSYRTNALNQYTDRDNNVVMVSGSADAGAHVVVGQNTVAAGRQGRFWGDSISVANSSGPWRGALSVSSGKLGAGPAGTDLARTDACTASIPKFLQAFTYDEDGNLTSDGIWTYTWDAENRLGRMTTTSAAVMGGYPNREIDFRYDYLGRRVEKKVFDLTNSQTLTTRRFIYEGWNLIAEYTVTPAQNALVMIRSYTWGLDIARTFTDAGGVGALLEITDHASGKAYFPTYDGNGNIATLINASPTTYSLAAAYEYSPYGEALRAEIIDGAISDQPFRFSTKYWDQETGLYYYGMRFYDPRNGRFLSRDLNLEKGGLHLYSFCLNNPINYWDVRGMYPASFLTSQIDGSAELDEYFMGAGPNGSDPDGIYHSTESPLQFNIGVLLMWQNSPVTSLNSTAPFGSGPVASRPPENSGAQSAVKPLTDEEKALLKDWQSHIKFNPAGDRNADFEKQVIADFNKLLTTATSTGVEIMIARSLINPNLPPITINYGTTDNYISTGGSRNLYLNSTPGQLYTNKEHFDLRASQGELPTGPNASAIVLAHELGHSMVSDGFGGMSEYGAVTFMENAYRDAFHVGRRTSYDGVPLDDRSEKDSDTDTWNTWSGKYKNPTPWKGDGD